MKSPPKKSAKASRQTPLKESDVRNFLASYKKAWETRDADLAANLFTRDARYKQDPFATVIVGREDIHNYWAGATGRQQDVRYSLEAFVHTGYLVAAEWTCSYTDSSTGQRKELAGMFLADFYGKQVRNFREYWHSRPGLSG